MAGKIIYYGTGINKDHSGRWRDPANPPVFGSVPYEEAHAFFPGSVSFVAGLQAAIAAASAEDGGEVFVGCDYPEPAEKAFLLDYRDPASRTLVIKDRNNVVIDFGGATLRQVNFAQVVAATNGLAIDPFADPPEGTPELVGPPGDQRWDPRGFPIIRVENCRNIRIENLILDGNRRGAAKSSWGTEAPSAAPSCNGAQVADHGIHVVGGSDIVFRNVRVIEAKSDGFQTHYATDNSNGFSAGDMVRRVTYEDCSAIRCGRAGFGGDWGHEIKLVRCYAAEHGMDFEYGGVTRRAMYDGPADGAHFECWPHALEAPGHRQLTVEGCTFERNGGRGLVFGGYEFPDGVLVSDCLFDDNGRRTTFQGVTRTYSHLEIAASGATVTGCTFRPIRSCTGSVIQPALVFLTVNAVGGEGESWRKAGHRIVGNHFVGSDQDDEDMGYAWRHAIEVSAQNIDGQAISQDGGTTIEGNHFQRCWGAAYLRAPYSTFRGNSVIDGIAVPGSIDQAAVVIAHYARCARVSDNLFWNTTSRALWVWDGHVVEGYGDCSDLWFRNNIVRYTTTTLIHDAAVELGAACGARVRLLDNLFDRVEAAPTKAAVRFVASGNPTLWRGIVLRGNVARGAGWSTSGTPTGPWQMAGVPWLEKVLEANGNDPALPGETVTQPGRGLRLTAPDASMPAVPGTLWYDGGNDRPMFRTASGDQNLLAGTMSGPEQRDRERDPEV